MGRQQLKMDLRKTPIININAFLRSYWCTEVIDRNCFWTSKTAIQQVLSKTKKVLIAVLKDS
jgi:hypothetical protein